ncbi:MAG: 3-dehydro-L-gulonate-6-phosphate decarboxylase [Chloroflexota bacterium]
MADQLFLTIRQMSPNKPKLQLALDNRDLQSALSAVQSAHSAIDVIEVGTVLCVAEGMNAVRTMRTLYPSHTILADVRIIRAGGAIADMVFDAGANWVSVMGEAPLDTIKAALQKAQEYGGEVQIEMGEGWTMDHARQWAQMSIEQVIFHRSHEADQEVDEMWNERDFDQIRELTEMGLKVTVTGGITPADVPLFKGIPIYIFIAGRAIRNADDPLTAAQEFQEIIRQAYDS